MNITQQVHAKTLGQNMIRTPLLCHKHFYAGSLKMAYQLLEKKTHTHTQNTQRTRENKTTDQPTDGRIDGQTDLYTDSFIHPKLSFGGLGLYNFGYPICLTHSHTMTPFDAPGNQAF